MKNKTKKQPLKHKIKYTDDLGEMDDFDQSHVLTLEEQRAVGIPSIEEVEKMPIVVRKTTKDARMNIRLGADVLEGLKSQAARLGMPYQTLAASVLHMVASGEIHLTFLHQPLVPSKKRTATQDTRADRVGYQIAAKKKKRRPVKKQIAVKR